MQRKLLPVLIFICQGIVGYGQKTEWYATKDWKIYNCFQFSSFNDPVNSLKRYKYLLLSDDTLHNLLTGSNIDDTKKETPLWMGMYTITYSLDGMERKILVSMYGGFFWDAGSKRYYQIEDNKKQQWLDYFANLNLSGFNE